MLFAPVVHFLYFIRVVFDRACVKTLRYKHYYCNNNIIFIKDLTCKVQAELVVH